MKKVPGFELFRCSSSKTTVGLNTTPVPILALLAISLMVNVVVGAGLADSLITADSRKEIQTFGKDWLGKVLALSSHRQKQKKRRAEGKTKKAKEANKVKSRPPVKQEVPVKKYNFEDNPFWSSESFPNFETNSRNKNQDWLGSHVPFGSKF